MNPWLCWILALAAAALSSLPFPMDAAEEGRLAATDSDGEPRWRAEWSMEAVTQQGQPLVHLIEEGQGVHSPFSQQVRWSFQAWWLAGPPLQPSRVEKRFSDLEGKLLLSNTTEFDWKARRARIETREGQGDAQVKSVQVPPGTWTPQGMAIALRQMDFEGDRPLKAHLLSDEPKVYQVRFKKVGKETLDTPNGPVECYKLRMEVDLGFLSLFKFLLPDTHFWFAAHPPHMWVRYQGLESGRGTPKVIRQMTSFTRHGE